MHDCMIATGNHDDLDSLRGAPPVPYRMLHKHRAKSHSLWFIFLKKIRKEVNGMKRGLKRGFTLAELLIVIAIIAILVGVMFPVFSEQLDKARTAVELANVRTKYSELAADAILGSTNLTASEYESPTILSENLAAALKYDDTRLILKNPRKKRGVIGAVTVKYSEYIGSFQIDDDISFSEQGTFDKKHKISKDTAITP